MAGIENAMRWSCKEYLKAFFAEQDVMPQACLVIGANGSGKSVFSRFLCEEIFPHVYGGNLVIAYATGNHYADTLKGMDPGIIRVEPLTNDEFRDLHEELIAYKKCGSTASYVLICDDLPEGVKPKSPAERFALLARNARAIPIFTFHCISAVPKTLMSSVPHKFFLSFGLVPTLSEKLRPVIQFPFTASKNDICSALTRELCVKGSILLWTTKGSTRVIIFQRDGMLCTPVAAVSQYLSSK